MFSLGSVAAKTGCIVDKDAVFAHIKELLVSEFKFAPESIEPEKRLIEDLDLDSLDTVDLIVAFKYHLNNKIEPARFKKLRTIQDVVDLLQPLWKTP